MSNKKPMNGLEIAGNIETIIRVIATEGDKSQSLIEAKAEAIRDYDRELAVLREFPRWIVLVPEFTG